MALDYNKRLGQKKTNGCDVKNGIRTRAGCSTAYGVAGIRNYQPRVGARNADTGAIFWDRLRGPTSRSANCTVVPGNRSISYAEDA